MGLLAITSADRLFADWSRSRSLRTESHVSALLRDVPPHCAVVTVNDGHPAALAWLGSVRGHRVAPLGVETFGQSGSIDDLYASLGFDVNGLSGPPKTSRRAGLSVIETPCGRLSEIYLRRR